MSTGRFLRGKTQPGRAAEVERLMGAVERADGGVMQFIAIEGEAGFGKTTLVNHLIALTPEWQHHVVEIDPSDEQVEGSALRRLMASMMGHRRITLAEGVEQLVQQWLDIRDAQSGKICTVLEDVQWIDTLSAEVLWRSASEATESRSVVVLTCRPDSERFLSRFERFLSSDRQGELLRLEPLSVEGVREVLADRLNAPVSSRVAATVHEATSGIPLLLNTVAQWLADAPSSRRNLSSALAALHSRQDGSRRIFDHALLSTMDSLSEAQRFAVSLLAVGGSHMPPEQIQEILGGEGYEKLSLESLQIAGLTSLRADSGEVAITHPGLSPLITRQFPVEQRAHLHGVLARHLSSEEATHHTVRALQLVPDAEALQKLVPQLTQTGADALAERRFDAAFRHFQWATWFSAEPRLLTLAIRAGVLANSLELLPSLATQLDNAPTTRAICSAKAQMLLAEGDLLSALNEIAHGLSLPEPDWDYAGTILLAYALAGAGRLAYATAQFGVAAGPIDSALEQLRAAQEVLSGAAQQDPRIAPLIPEVVSLQALLRLWSGLRHGDPARLGEFSVEMQKMIAELESIPGTQPVVRTINGVLGAIARQQDHLPSAYAMLRSAYEGQSDTDEITVHTATHLGLIAFHSAHWDEAQELFTRAIEESLLLPEDAGALLAYAAAALVPLSRGEIEEGERLLRRVEGQRADGGDLIRVATAFARGMGATMTGDHEEAVRALAIIDETTFGWAYVGYTYIALYARVLVVTGRGELLVQLRQRVERETGNIPMACREAISLTLDSAVCWVSGNPAGAYEKLDRTLQILDDFPPVWPSADSPPGTGYALFRALVALHLGQVVLATPELARHNRATADRVRDAASVFLRCGTMFFHAESSALAESLTQARTKPEPAPSTDARREEAYRHLSTLTSRERQIALEVAQGKSNREIATQLFLSVRTVEYHVANCFAKLDLPSRIELRTALRPALEMRVAARAR